MTIDSNNGASEGTYPHTPDMAGYTVREEPMGTTKHVRIVCIGAGASGINLIRTLRRNLRDYELAVYEKNEDVGGTWHENRYPGCRCDVPSHSYQFSWRPKKDWSNFFSPAAEIADYLRQTCEEEDMMSAIKLGHKVTNACWNEEAGLWELRVMNLQTGDEFADQAHFLINGSGILNNWKWPSIEGLHDFKGNLIHSAQWPKDFDYKGKTVAVIGNGSSGIQIVPAIQPDVKRLVHVVRTPTWIIPPRVQVFAMGAAGPMLKQIQMDEQENFSPEQIEKFKTDPELYKTFVKTIEKEVNGAFPIILKDSPTNAFATQHIKQYMAYQLKGDEKLCKALIPTYPLGCRRMTPAPAYLPSLAQPNVDLVTSGLKRVVHEGFEMESGEVIQLDAIICASGFDLSFSPRFPIVGREGNLQDIWAEGSTPKSYMSCTVPGMPNYFTFLGPNGPNGHGSVFTLSERIARYITLAIRKCQTENIKALAPTHAATDDMAAHVAAFMPRTAWSASCRSWFKAGKEQGPVTALHPGSRTHFLHMLGSFRGEDYEYVYDEGARGNRFWFLGNGFSTREVGPEADSAWYLDGDMADLSAD